MQRTNTLESKHKSRPKRLIPWGFQISAITPMTLILILFSVYPLVQLVLISFSSISFQGGQRVWQWVGFQNYLRIPGDTTYWTAMLNNFVYAAATVSIELVLGLTLALLTMRIKQGAVFYRTILMLPLLVPPIALATAWRLIYNGNFGLINRTAAELGLPLQYWLSSPDFAMMAVIIVSVWHWTAYVFILLLAGLQNIPGDVYEAASIDGAKGWHILRYITLPLLMPVIIVTIMFRTIHSFKVFDIVYALTGGGPGVTTEVLNTYVYKVFISQQRLGYGAALAVVGVIVVGVLALLYTRFFGVKRGTIG